MWARVRLDVGARLTLERRSRVLKDEEDGCNRLLWTSCTLLR